jgi:hypothetical protein
MSRIQKLEKGVIMKRAFGIIVMELYRICRVKSMLYKVTRKKVRRRDHKSIAFSLTTLIF